MWYPGVRCGTSLYRYLIFAVFLTFPTGSAVAQWRPRGRGFEPHRRRCVVSLSKNINPSLVLVQPRKTRPFITERLLMGRKESNQTNNYFFNNVIERQIPADQDQQQQKNSK